MNDDLIASLERRIASLEAMIEPMVNGGNVDPFRPVFLASRPENKKWAEQTVAAGSTTAFIDGRACTDAKHDCAARQLKAAEQVLVEVEDASSDRYVALRDDAQVVKIAANNATGGVYDGKVMGKPADSKFGDLAVDLDAIIYSTEELGLSTHWLAAGTYAPGIVFGVNSAGKALVAIPSGVYRTATPDTLGAGEEGAEAADTGSWERATDDAPLDLWLASRMVYNEAGDKTIYAYLRKLTFDAGGRLVAASAETRVTVETPEDGCV